MTILQDETACEVHIYARTFKIKSAYLKCHTYLVLCRCPACGSRQDNRSWSVTLIMNKKTLRGSSLFRLFFSSSTHQASGILQTYIQLFITTLLSPWDVWSKSLLEVYTVHSKGHDDIFSAPGDQDGSVVMGMVVIIQDVLALLPNAEVL